LQACGVRYIAYWLDRNSCLQAAARAALLLLPVNIRALAVGWPTRLLDRMGAVDAEVCRRGPITAADFTTGSDTTDDLARTA
jgi:hypothetical protein